MNKNNRKHLKSIPGVMEIIDAYPYGSYGIPYDFIHIISINIAKIASDGGW